MEKERGIKSERASDCGERYEVYQSRTDMNFLPIPKCDRLRGSFKPRILRSVYMRMTMETSPAQFECLQQLREIRELDSMGQ